MNASYITRLIDWWRDTYDRLEELHERAHLFAAEQLGLRARMQEGRAVLADAGRWEHIAVLITPTIPSLFLFLISVIGLFARFFLFKLFFLATLPFTGALLAICASDWGYVAAALLNPYKPDDAPRLLVISRLPRHAQEDISARMRQKGVKPTWASSGSEIKEALNWRHYDMIILDNALDQSHAIANTLAQRRELAQTEIVVLEPHQDIHHLEQYL